MDDPFPARPFLKWAGGKGQVKFELLRRTPTDLNNGWYNRYIEPFLGGGAIFFFFAQVFRLQEYFLSDINPRLMMTYRVLKNHPEELLDNLEDLKARYQNSRDKETFYYDVRRGFNREDGNNWTPVKAAAQLIFLNHTCYNGLYRVNNEGKFNVPFGRYKNPQIYDPEVILADSKVLRKANIDVLDFRSILPDVANDRSFIYLDPPYRPVSATSSFTKYAQQDFTDKDQKMLACVFRKCDKKGAYIMLNNSQRSPFFEELYKEFTIRTMQCSRAINCKAEKRGKVDELVITNYRY